MVNTANLRTRRLFPDSQGSPSNACAKCATNTTTWDVGSTSKEACVRPLTNTTHQFVSFMATFFMLSNAGGLNLEAHEGGTISDCVAACDAAPGCKAFDAGNDASIYAGEQTGVDGSPAFAQNQKGNCFLSYDDEESIKDRDVRAVPQLMLFRKIEARHVKPVYFMRLYDGFIRGADGAGRFENKHSPEACAQLCLDDPNCASFDAGRPSVTSRANERLTWVASTDTCYLSYYTKERAEATAKRLGQKSPWVQPSEKSMDYFERITPLFVRLNVKYDDLVNPKCVPFPTSHPTPTCTAASTSPHHVLTLDLFSPLRSRAPYYPSAPASHIRNLRVASSV